MNILVIGPCIRRTKGGMATIIRSFIESPIILRDYQIRYLTTHVDGFFLQKIFYGFRGLIFLLMNYQKYDIVHVHSASDVSFYRKSLFVRLCKVLKKKVFIHIHGGDFDTFYLGSLPIFQRYISKTLYKADFIVVLSEHWNHFFKDHFNLNGNIFTLPNGINPEIYQRCINNHRILNNFLFLGRLEEKKGIYDLLKAIDILINLRG